VFLPRAPIGAKFCIATRTQPCQISDDWCNESPLRVENADFWPVGKNNTGNPAAAAANKVNFACGFSAQLPYFVA